MNITTGDFPGVIIPQTTQWPLGTVVGFTLVSEQKKLQNSLDVQNQLLCKA